MEGTGHGSPFKKTLIKFSLMFCALLWASDIVYKVAKDISYVNRGRCILFKNLPKTGFLFFEYFFETAVIVFLGTFIAVWLSRTFMKHKGLFPQNPLTAFLYGSILPVCSCAALPLLSSMKGKMKFSAAISFVLAAPLLSPYIVVLSFSVLGMKYGILRIIASFILVTFSALILSLLLGKGTQINPTFPNVNCNTACGGESSDIYLETFSIFKKLLPFLAIGGGIGLALEYQGTRQALLAIGSGRGLLGTFAWIFFGAFLYFCNGAEVLFLRPLVSHGFPIGTAIAFSMTSTAVCTTSIAMLFRIIGVRLTIALVGCVIGISLASALLINAVL